jgi:hypothetical protein
LVHPRGLGFRPVAADRIGWAFVHEPAYPNSSLCPLWLIKGKPGWSQKRVVPAVRLEPPTHIDCANSNSLLQARSYAVLENACSSGIVQRNASARSRNTRIPYSPCASRIILNMLAKPNCSSVATTTARRE